jgi:queuine tRNA-ribosyltransferase
MIGGKIPKRFELIHGPVALPAFLPDATRAVVRSVDAQDLLGCGVEALVMNTFHLMQHPGSSTIQALGGLHKLSGWPRPIITDSGGFQAYSLIRQNPKQGSLTAKGITCRMEGSDKKVVLTPEKSIQLQLSYGTDVAICLDDCTSVDESTQSQVEAVERTVAWARRCKAEFQRLVQEKKLSPEKTPRLFAVIQGGGSLELRKRCAVELLEIGFDGFGYGGWPLDEGGNLLAEIIAHTRDLIPRECPMRALGIESPRKHPGLFRNGLRTIRQRHSPRATPAAGCAFTVDPTTDQNYQASGSTWYTRRIASLSSRTDRSHRSATAGYALTILSVIFITCLN